MAEAKDRAGWNRTMALLAGLFNVNRDPKKTRPIDPMQFFPWHERQEEQAPPPTEADREVSVHFDATSYLE